MSALIIYLSGWILFVIGYYIFNVYIDNEDYMFNYVNKKLILYRGFLYGIGSWFFIIIIIGIVLALYLGELNEWIEHKLMDD